MRREEDTHKSARANYRYMGEAQLRSVIASMQKGHGDCRRELFFVTSKLAALKAKCRNMKDRLRDALKRGELKKVIDELVAAYEDGKFKGKRSLWNFLKDLVHATHLTKDDGTANRGMRWSEQTSRLFEVLRRFGGPRTYNFFRDNVAAPHQRTTERRWAENKFHFQPGLNQKTIEYIEGIYKDKMDQLKLGFPVPVECSEDETNILAELRWNHRRDALPGT